MGTPVWAQWNANPVTLIVCIVLLGGYLLAIGPLRERLLPGVVVSPLDTLGREYLLTARMTQLLLIVTFVAPLLMIGLPEELATRLIPVRKWREAMGTTMFVVVAVVGFNVITLFWQIPRFYELSVRDTLWHDVANLCYLLAGILTWWPLLTPTNLHARMSNPLQMVYLALESLPLDIFGVAIIFAPAALYSVYVDAPRITSLSVMADQQIAGALLAVPGNLLDILFMSIIFFVWIERIERAQRRREQAAIERELAAEAARATTDTPLGGEPSRDASDAAHGATTIDATD